MSMNFVGIAKRVAEHRNGDDIPTDIAQKFSNKGALIRNTQNLFGIIEGIQSDPVELHNFLSGGKRPKKLTDGRWSLRINDTYRICFVWDDRAYDVGIAHKRNLGKYL